MLLINTNKIIWIFWISINLSYLTLGLKDVYVTVPTAVKRGDNATLICRYDLEQEKIYSIKWYKGKREFYRYTPMELIPIKVFQLPGINVERSLSNASDVILTSIESSASGKYSCEVSADAPTFHTGFQSAYLEVVDFPTNGPTIEAIDKIYSIGDILQANCTINNSKPQANLTWLINNYVVMPHHLVRYNFTQDDFINMNRHVLGLKLVLTPKHFRSKTLRVACKASVYDIYENITEKLLDLDENSNQILSDDFSTIGSSRHTQFDGSDFYGYGNEHDIKMHHIQASPDMSSSSSPAAIFSFPIFVILQMIILSSAKSLMSTANDFSFLSISINFQKYLLNYNKIINLFKPIKTPTIIISILFITFNNYILKAFSIHLIIFLTILLVMNIISNKVQNNNYDNILNKFHKFCFQFKSNLLSPNARINNFKLILNENYGK